MKPLSLFGKQSAKKPVSNCFGTILAIGSFYTVETCFGKYFNVPSVCGRCAIGDQVLLLFGDPENLRHPVIVSNSSKVISDTVVSPRQSQAIGEWMQTEGNFYLSQPGKLSSPIPSTAAELLPIGDFSDSTPGFSRLFGCVAQDGVYILAYYKTNVLTGNFSHLRLHAYVLNPSFRSPLWQFEIPLPAEIASTPDRRFRSNIFLDVSDGVITVCDHLLFSARLKTNLRSVPSEFKITNTDVKYFASIAGKFALRSNLDFTLSIHKRNPAMAWTQVGANYDLTTLNPFGAVFQWMSTSFLTSRPWPFNPTENKFKVLWNSSPGDKIVSASTAGIFSVESIPPRSDFSAPDIILEEALADGDQYMEDHNGGLPMSGPPGPALPGYTVGGAQAVWGGRLTWGNVPSFPTTSPNYWIHDGSDGVTINTTPPYIPPYFYVDPWPIDFIAGGGSSIGYLCPRPISNIPSTAVNSFETSLIAQWIENRPGFDSQETDMIPCLRQDSELSLIWAKIDPLLASVPNPRSMNYVEPGAGDVGQDKITVHHWPQKQFFHQTLLCKRSSTGGMTYLNISPEFDGLTYSFANEVTLSNMFKIPVNVWDIKLCQNDCLLVLQDWTDAKEQEHRPALRSVSKAMISLDLLHNLHPTDTEIDGSYTWKIVDRAMVVNISVGYKWAVVGLFYLHANMTDYRTDIKFIDISNLSALTVVTTLTGENADADLLPRAIDFDRMVFAKKTPNTIGTEQCYWVGDVGDGPKWYQFGY